MKEAPDAEPQSLEWDEFEQRNQFLHLLLGLISIAETVLTSVRGAVGEPPPAQRKSSAGGKPADLLR